MILKDKTVLIVDNDTLISKELISRLKERVEDITVLVAKTIQQATIYAMDTDLTIHAAVVNIDMASNVVKFTMKLDIPTIIIADTMNEETKESISHYDILDCLVKENTKFIKQTVHSIYRILKNYSTKVLIVDDSKLQLKAAVDILQKSKLIIETAQDGIEAYNMVQNAKEPFSLILTDYNMPNMNGLELTLKLREDYEKDELGIIVLSADKSQEIPIEFIKMGANDYINKPYTQIEVNTRVNSNLDMLELFQEIKDLANKDFLTGAYNRRYFFESGHAIFSKAKRENRDLCVAMFDIDKFKNINDTYGHDVGDIAIKEIARILNKNLRDSDLMARFGGEEFCVLLEDISKKDAKKLFEKIRIKFEKNVFKALGHKIKYTVSIGISYGMKDTIEDMIKKADDGLYYCKNNGRNQIFITKH